MGQVKIVPYLLNLFTNHTYGWRVEFRLSLCIFVSQVVSFNCTFLTCFNFSHLECVSDFSYYSPTYLICLGEWSWLGCWSWGCVMWNPTWIHLILFSPLFYTFKCPCLFLGYFTLEGFILGELFCYFRDLALEVFKDFWMLVLGWYLDFLHWNKATIWDLKQTPLWRGKSFALEMFLF